MTDLHRSTRLTPPRSADDIRADIQGFITSGYGHLPVRGVCVRPASPMPRSARRWIGGIVAGRDHVGSAWPRDAGR